MSVHFTLADIDPEVPPQKEIIRVDASSFGCSHSKKRKVEELYDLDTPAANLFMATDIMLNKYIEKVETIDDLVAINKKNSLKLEKAKQKTKVLKAMLSRRSNQDPEDSETDKIPISEAKRDAAVAVLEARILMAMEAAENGQDTSMWDVKDWRNKLAEIKGGYTTSLSPTSCGGSKAPKRKATKAPKIRITDVPLMIKGESSRPGDNEDTAMVGDIAGSEGSSGEEGI